MAETVKIELDAELKDYVMNRVAKMLKSSMPNVSLEKPIVGSREDNPNRIILIYEGVTNANEVCLSAMCAGASLAQKL